MLRLSQIAVIAFLVAGSCMTASAQQSDEIPLGDVARQLRAARQGELSTTIIDNDNFDLLMDKAESERLEGQPVFAISPSGRTFTAVSPDGVCSLSFDARTEKKNSGFIATDLPQYELAKLDGPAAVQDGELEVSVHNGTSWELTQIEVGVTMLQARSGPPEYRFATLAFVPDATPEKLPDTTILYHLTGRAEPGATTVFRTTVDAALGGDKEWHWGIVGARGIPPAAPTTALQQPFSPAANPTASYSPPEPAQPSQILPSPTLDSSGASSIPEQK
jgi:hypothetical protein